MHKAKVKNNRLVFENLDKFKEQVASFEGKDVVVKVEVPKTKRTLKQNRYYFAILNELERALGADKDSFHEIFKEKFLDMRRFVIQDKFYETRASTKQLSTKEMNEYVEKVIAFSVVEWGMKFSAEFDYV